MTITDQVQLHVHPKPFSPVESTTKFSTVLGTTLPNKPKTIRPTDEPSTLISKNTLSVTVRSGSGSAFAVGQQAMEVPKTAASTFLLVVSSIGDSGSRSELKSSDSWTFSCVNRIAWDRMCLWTRGGLLSEKHVLLHPCLDRTTVDLLIDDQWISVSIVSNSV